MVFDGFPASVLWKFSRKTLFSHSMTSGRLESGDHRWALSRGVEFDCGQDVHLPGSRWREKQGQYWSGCGLCLIIIIILFFFISASHTVALNFVHRGRLGKAMAALRISDFSLPHPCFWKSHLEASHVLRTLPNPASPSSFQGSIESIAWYLSPSFNCFNWN